MRVGNCRATFLLALAVSWLLVAPSEAALPKCLQDARWASDPLDRTNLVGALVAVRTSRGNLALLLVNSGPTLLISNLTVYEPSGRIMLHKRGMRIGPSSFFDADSGLERSRNADLWWHSISSGVSRLEPRNGAQLHLCSHIRGRTRAEWLEYWAFLADTSEEAARRGKCGALWELARCLPRYCQSDAHCQFGHFWGDGHWDQERKARCIYNECREDELDDLIAYGYACYWNFQCSGRDFEGECVNNSPDYDGENVGGFCDSYQRKTCHGVGKYEPCITLDGRIGKAECREWKRLGSCIALEYQPVPP